MKDHFIAHFKARGWAIEVVPARVEAALRRKVQCPRCAQLNEPEETACSTCGLLLREPCPNCGETAPRYGGGCRCGFPIAQRDLVDDLIGQAKKALDLRELAQAEVVIGRAARIWSLPPGRSDPITARIQKVQFELASAQHKLQSAQETIQKHMSKRRFVAAAAELLAAPDNLPGRAVLLDQADTAVRKARKLCHEARRAGTPRAQQIELYIEALRLCDDMEEARAELARIPPEPPANVRATASDPAIGVLVSWQPSNDPDVSYLVVRRTGRKPPEMPEDLQGQRQLGATRDTSFRDRSAADIAGEPLTYAVFTERSGTFSSASAADPIIVMAESDIQARPEDGHVVLTWRSPLAGGPGRGYQARVGRIGRTCTAPSPGDRPVDRQGCPGSACGTATRFGPPTRIRRDGLCWSAGASMVVIPAEKPTPERLIVVGTNPDLGLYEHKVEIRFRSPERGCCGSSVRHGVESLREGDQFPEDQVPADGHLLRESLPVTDYLIDEEFFYSYVPVLMANGIAYVGTSRHYALGDEVSGMQCEFAGQFVRIGWHWPDEGEEALIGYHPVRPLIDPTDTTNQVKAARLANERIGGCDIPVEPTISSLNIVVAIVIKHQDVDFVTSGLRRRIDRSGTRVRYGLHMSGRRRQELILRSTEPVELPSVMLRGRAGHIPRTRDDGVLVASYHPMRLADRQVLSLPKPDQPALAYRLFTESAATAGTVELDT